jgi:ABC-type dipeptide/oligopeptide/nickel transport system permease subunit
MTSTPPEVLAGVATLTALFVVGAVFGRLHGSGGEVRPIGDRVMSGLLALPLIVLLVRLVFPHTHRAWALFAASPLAFYVLLLAGTDLGWKWCRERFTLSLLVGVAVLYVIGAVMFWLRAV